MVQRARDRILAAWLVGGLSAAAAVPVRAEATDAPIVLTPHRAVYDITLDRSRGGSGVADLTGRMVYELTGNACDGYTQNMRFVTSMTNQEGNAAVTDLRTSSWEDDAGRTFRFSSSQYKDRRLSEATEGEATRGPGTDVTVALTKPDKRHVQLHGRPLFPVQHSKALVASARRGQSLLSADLYDGSEKGDKAYSTISFIGTPRAAGDNRGLPDVASAKPLDKVRAWPVSISYYEPGKEKEDSLPSYELAFLYYENGVTRRLFIDYGDFSIRGALKEITFLDPGKCAAR